MEINKDKRLEVYKQSSDVVKELYGSSETGRTIGIVEKEVGIDTENQSTIFALAIGDVILGLYKKDSLGQLLKDRLGLTEQQVETALSGLRKLLERIPNDPQPASNPLIIDPGVIAGVNSNAQQTLAIDHSLVKPLRTFADDVALKRAHGYGTFRGENVTDDEDEPVHSSSQDDIIKK